MMLAYTLWSATHRSKLARAVRAVLLFSLAATSWNCAPGDYENATDTRQATDGRDSTAPPATGQTAQDAATALLEPGALKTVDGVVVEGRTGPGGRPFEVARRTPDPPQGFSRQFGTITLDIALRTRTPDLSQYPCISCHMGGAMRLSSQRVRDAHQNIQPVHPAETGATCRNCHAPENVELLAFQSGQRTTIDHAYRLCAQCHNAQVTAWAAGAHGKRLDGWQGRRVVLGCAACHDPHQPALQKRTPFRAPQIERKRRDP
ncbi:MAG: hypothetical protein WEE89_07545 [Gemmatimonadota bacterium]